jgi:hypothetical protein
MFSSSDSAGSTAAVATTGCAAGQGEAGPDVATLTAGGVSGTAVAATTAATTAKPSLGASGGNGGGATSPPGARRPSLGARVPSRRALLHGAAAIAADSGGDGGAAPAPVRRRPTLREAAKKVQAQRAMAAVTKVPLTLPFDRPSGRTVTFDPGADGAIDVEKMNDATANGIAARHGARAGLVATQIKIRAFYERFDVQARR